MHYVFKDEFLLDRFRDDGPSFIHSGLGGFLNIVDQNSNGPTHDRSVSTKLPEPEYTLPSTYNSGVLVQERFALVCVGSK